MNRLATGSASVRWGVCAVLCVTVGCSTSRFAQQSLVKAPPVANAQWESQVLSAATAQALEVRFSDAVVAQNPSATVQRLLARRALFRGDDAARYRALVAAMSDLGNPDALLDAQEWRTLPWTHAQRDEAEALLEVLSKRHPDWEVRAFAASQWVAVCRLRGDLGCVRRAQERISGRLALAWIGAWDNDQGKGFDAVLPPETELDFRQRYPAALVDVTWRRDVAADPAGLYELGELFSPSRWAVAYAASAVSLPQAQDVELRIQSSDPLKVFVDGQLVLEIRSVSSSAFDQFVVPLKLSAGAHRVLLKSAHEEGEWSLGARLTGVRGKPLTFTPLPADAPATPGVQVPTMSARMLLDRRAPVGPELPALYRRVEWARRMGLLEEEVTAAHALVQAAPTSVIARWSLQYALWSKGERGKAGDLLTELSEQAGDVYPYFRLQQGRFWQQQGFRQKARQILLATRDRHPQQEMMWRYLADLFESEGWTEDRCSALVTALHLQPDRPALQAGLADCHLSLGEEAAYERQMDALGAVLPGDAGHLARTVDRAIATTQWKRALQVAQRFSQLYPNRLGPWFRLAEIHRRMGNSKAAEQALTQVLALNPENARAYELRGRYAYQRDDVKAATAAWQSSLERNPGDDKLANRLAYLSPAVDGVWAADVPDEAAIAAVLEKRKSLPATPGADVVHLMDHGVMLLKADGSTLNVTTQISVARNQAGRDELTSVRLAGDGRLRILAAYAVDPAGRRAEAASIQGSVVRFRGLQVGAAVVVQYRRDSPPEGYLARHLSRTWYFQGISEHNADSEWVLYVPASTQVHEEKSEPIVREEKPLGELRRIAYRAKDVPPLIPEVDMPASFELLSQVTVSTVPTWDDFLRWEESLLTDAFRDSPALNALADRLVDGVTDPLEKAYRLQSYLMEEIRYQQDYENHVAGVKPHPASLVLERGYGDCKDKVVLFMTLASRVGLTAQYALIRTRDRGAVKTDIPSQQFNHVIVYLPPQTGLKDGLFMDPTADALDLNALRSDNSGTRSLVYDHEARTHRWIDIPYQPATRNLTAFDAVLHVAEDGRTRGELSWSAVGEGGSQLRRTSRNPERLQKVVEQVVPVLFPGATVKDIQPVEMQSLRKPAALRAQFEGSNVARWEGEELRIKLPFSAMSARAFSMGKRNFPLVLGAPQTQRFSIELPLSQGLTLKRLPETKKLTARCFSYERSTRKTETGLQVTYELSNACERISPQEYAAHRELSEQMMRVQNEEIVLTKAAPAKTIKRPL